jgi:hypothetical protein
MKLKLSAEQADALQTIRQNGEFRSALAALLDHILAEKFKRPLLETNLEQFSELGSRKLSYQKARLDGAFDFIRIFQGEINPHKVPSESNE